MVEVNKIAIQKGEIKNEKNKTVFLCNVVAFQKSELEIYTAEMESIRKRNNKKKEGIRMIKWVDKMFDNFIYWLERVQWARDRRRFRRKKKKSAKANALAKKEIEKAKKILRDNGIALERDWSDIEYKGEKYTPVMIEEYSNYSGDSIIITAKKI